MLMIEKRRKTGRITGPMVIHSTSAPCAWKEDNCVQVRESQNLTMPSESPETIVPSLQEIRNTLDYKRTEDEPKNSNSPHQSTFTVHFLKSHAVNDSSSRNIPFPQTAIRISCDEP